MPRTPGEHLAAAGCFERKQQWKEAEEQFRLARPSVETVAPATVGRARALYHLNQPFDAMLELEDFLRKNPDFVPALQLFATLHSLVREDNRRAIEIMERCSQLAPDDAGVWQYLGNLYHAKGRDEEALRCFERAVQLAPQDAQALASLAYAYAKLGRAEESRARFDQALKALPRAAEPAVVWLIYGKALQDDRRWEESRASYGEALKIDPKLSEAHYGRAVAKENLGDLSGAEADALAAIEEHPVPRKDAHLLLIRVARAQKDAAKIERYARRLSEIDAEEAKAKESSRILSELLFKAEPLFMQGDFVQAAAAYEELVSRAPRFYEAYFALGMCYAKTARLPEAEEAFRKYLALQPLSADGHASLGLVLVQTGRFAEARAALGRAIELDPEMPGVRDTLARLQASPDVSKPGQEAGPSSDRLQSMIEEAEKLMQAGNFGKALEILNALIQAGQAPPDVYILTATCHLNRLETALAFEVFERGISLYPAQQVLEEFYVRLLTNYVPVEQMKEKLDKALALSPRSPVLLRASAYLEIRLDPRGEQARRVVSQLVEVAPDIPGSHLVYGRWAMLNKQAEIAVREWERALALAGDDARTRLDILTLLADAHDSLNQADRAEAAFKEAFKINALLEKPNAASAFLYAEFLGKQGRAEESQAVIDQILRWVPTYGPALLQRAFHAARANRPEEAVAAAEGALASPELNPQQKRAAHVLLARTYFLLKRTDEAEKHQQWLREQ